MKFVDYITQLMRLNGYECDEINGRIAAIRAEHFATETTHYTEEQHAASERIATLRGVVSWCRKYRLITIERIDNDDVFRLCNSGSLDEPAIEIRAPHCYSDPSFYGSFQMQRGAEIIKRLKKEAQQ